MKTNKPSKIVGIIHARGGSKRIPLKNIKLLNGKPLIGYMIEGALQSKLLERVIVSTDHQDIRRISLEFGAEVPFDRPKELSTDCPSELVAQHAVKYIEDEQAEEIDVSVTMQPTTPFCLGKDIDTCISMLMRNPDWDSVFSGKQVQERPEWMFRMDDTSTGNLLMGDVIKGDTGIMQTLPDLVIPNGAVYATRRNALFEQNVIISFKTGVYLMPLERSVDIDEPIDFEFAEFIANRKEGKGYE